MSAASVIFALTQMYFSIDMKEDEITPYAGAIFRPIKLLLMSDAVR